MSDILQHPLEEQAVDYVFGHLDEAGRVEFVRAMEGDPALIHLVAELSAAAAALSLSQAQSEVPPQAWDRLMQRLPAIAQERGVGVVAASPQARKPINITSLIGWGLAACFLLHGGSHRLALRRTAESPGSAGRAAAAQQRGHCRNEKGSGGPARERQRRV